MKIKLQFLFILSFLICNAFGKISFIKHGQRAKIFEITDNEIIVFKLTIPDEEFITLKEKTSAVEGYEYLDFINRSIKEYIELINSQNFTKIFPENDFKKLLPKLQLNNGYPTIDYKKYIILYDDFQSSEDNSSIIFDAFNNNSNLNLINVFYILSELKISSTANEDFKNLINLYGKDNVYKDKNGNFLYEVKHMNMDDDEDTEEVTEYIEESIETNRYTEFENNRNLEFPTDNFDELNDDELKDDELNDIVEENISYDSNENLIEEEDPDSNFKTKNATLKVEINR